MTQKMSYARILQNSLTSSPTAAAAGSNSEARNSRLSLRRARKHSSPNNIPQALAARVVPPPTPGVSWAQAVGSQKTGMKKVPEMEASTQEVGKEEKDKLTNEVTSMTAEENDLALDGARVAGDALGGSRVEEPFAAANELREAPYEALGTSMDNNEEPSNGIDDASLIYEKTNAEDDTRHHTIPGTPQDMNIQEILDVREWIACWAYMQELETVRAKRQILKRDLKEEDRRGEGFGYVGMEREMKMMEGHVTKSRFRF
ncbi:hypothetical protein BZA77DRAFT_367659 [Pyronema omphalodes]|nr:hypothetical protein BZA77DRAFT_367659 [Pyronema omphalodes]